MLKIITSTNVIGALPSEFDAMSLPEEGYLTVTTRGLFLDRPAAGEAANVLAAGGWMRRIDCLNLLRCQCECKGGGVFFCVRRRAGFRNRNDVTAADGPSQRDGCR